MVVKVYEIRHAEIEVPEGMTFEQFQEHYFNNALEYNEMLEPSETFFEQGNNRPTYTSSDGEVIML